MAQGLEFADYVTDQVDIGNVVEAPAYPGAKNSFRREDQIEDGEWLTNLLTVTAAELPAPKPRKKKKK